MKEKKAVITFLSVLLGVLGTLNAEDVTEAAVFFRVLNLVRL